MGVVVYTAPAELSVNARAGPNTTYKRRRQHKVSKSAACPRGVVGDRNSFAGVLRPHKGRFGVQPSQAAAVSGPTRKASTKLRAGTVAKTPATLAAEPVVIKVGGAALRPAEPVSFAAGGGLLAAAALLTTLAKLKPVVGVAVFTVLAASVAPPTAAWQKLMATAAWPVWPAGEKVLGQTAIPSFVS